MSVIEKKTMLCYRCMEEHEVQIVTEPEYNIFKGERVEYPATYFYCDRTDAYYSDGPMLNANDIAMKDAYRAKKGLLTSREIVALRQSYGVSQKDLAIILNWGEKTITRYESHQVQDAAYDAVLRRLDEDPEWYLQLLRKAKEQFSERTYQKYLRRARDRYAEREDTYRRKAIAANYASIGNLSRYSGNTPLDLDAVVNVVQYFADYVQNLFKVKLMKLMWYADALSYKRRGRTITGLAYQAMAMGAVPFAHDEIMELDGISYKEVDKGDGYTSKWSGSS